MIQRASASPAPFWLLAGAGKMGSALLRALPAFCEDQAWGVLEPRPSDEVMQWLERENRPCFTHADQIARLCTGVILATKPQDFPHLARDLAPFVTPSTAVLSIMAGIRADKIAALLGASSVIRAMPNLGCLYGQGITGIWSSPACSTDFQQDVQRLLSQMGEVLPLPAEADLDAVTALSGSGPAYAFLLVEALAQAGEAEGLSPSIAATLARATLISASAVLMNNPLSPRQLREQVTSAKGTTFAALEILMAPDGLSDLMARAVAQARLRAHELGLELNATD